MESSSLVYPNDQGQLVVLADKKRSLSTPQQSFCSASPTPSLFSELSDVLRSDDPFLSSLHVDSRASFIRHFPLPSSFGPSELSELALPFELQGAGASKAENGNTNNSGNHGVVNYSFYNTQYQNSVDMSDLLSSNATAYGHEGGVTNTNSERYDASSHSSNSVNSTLNSFFRLLDTGLGLVPLFASNKVETFQNSDRVKATQKGSSTVIDQAYSGCATYADRSLVPISSVTDAPTHAKPLSERFFCFTVGDWQQSTSRFQHWVVPLPGIFLTNPTLKQSAFYSLLRTHSITNCGWEVKVFVNATRFHGGLLGVFLIPEYNIGVTSQFPEFCNIRAFVAPDASFTRPWGIHDFNWFQYTCYPHQFINPRSNTVATVKVPYLNFVPATNSFTHSAWCLVIVVYSPLTVSSGGSTSLTIEAAISPTDVQYHGLRKPAPELQGPVVNQNHHNSYQFASTHPFPNQPVYGPMVKSSVNFIQPKVTDFLQLARIPTFCAKIKATFQADIPSGPLVQIDVSLAANDLATTMLASVAAGYANYRGCLRLTCIYAGNQMQNVRYMICYTPPGATPPATSQEAALSFYQICDTGLNSQSDFIVPYINTADWRYTNSNVQDEVSVGGYVSVFQLTRLAVPPGSPSTAEILFLFSAGDDFVLRSPCVLSYSLQADEPVSPAEVGVSASQGPENSVENARTLPVATYSSPTNLAFYFDRFFDCKVFQIDRYSTNTNYFVMELTLTNIFERIPEVLNYMMVTYFRADLEIAIRPKKNPIVSGTGGEHPSGINVVYFPPGSPIPPTTSEIFNVSINGTSTDIPVPRTVWKRGACPLIAQRTNTDMITFNIPYCSPLSAIPRNYNGVSSYAAHTWDNFGRAPGGTFGTLYIGHEQVVDANTPKVFVLSVRFKNFEGFLPRTGSPSRVLPDFSTATAERAFLLEPDSLTVYEGQRMTHTEAMRTAISQHSGATNYDMLLEAGDVEPNPGPLPTWLLSLCSCLKPPSDLERKFCTSCEMLDSTTSYSVVFDTFLCDTCFDFLEYMAVNKRARLLMSGDVESNPGPLFSKLTKAVADSVADKALEKFFDCSEFFKTITNFKDYFKLDDNDLAKKVLKILNKMIGYGLMAAAAAKDALTRAALVFILGGDLIAGIFSKLINFFKSYFQTSPPPIPPGLIPEKLKEVFTFTKTEDGTEVAEEAELTEFKMEGDVFRTVNSVFSLARHVTWAIEYLDKIKKWFLSWVKKENESPQQLFHKGMAEYSHYMTLHARVKSTPHHPDWLKCKKYFDHMREQASAFEPHYTRLFPIMTTPSAASDRPEPIVVVLRGKPGQGKTVSAVVLARLLSMYLSGKPDYYAMSNTLKHLDGYSQQPVVMIDDLGQDSSGQDFVQFCQMISSAPYYVPKADLSDKGMCFTSPVVIATTNMTEFHPNTLSDHNAVARRLNFDVKVVCDSAYRTDKGCLDFVRATKADRAGVSPLPFALKHPFPLLYKTCVSFQFEKETFGLLQLYNKIVTEIERRNKAHSDLDDLFILEGPEERKTLAQHLTEVARVEEPAVPRSVSADEIATAIRSVLGESVPPYKPPIQKYQEIMHIVIQVFTFLSMLLTGVAMLKFLFEGPYEGTAKTTEKKKTIKIVDLALQGGADNSLEMALIKKNIVSATVVLSSGERKTSALFVKDRYCLMNYHLVQDAVEIILDRKYSASELVMIRPNYKNVSSDLVLVSCPSDGRNYRDITMLFATADELQITPGLKCTGINCASSTPFLYSGTPVHFTDKIFTPQMTVPNVMRYKAETQPGYCGSVVVCDWGVRKRIVGLHSAGNHGTAAASVLTREGLLSMLNYQLEGLIVNAQPHQYVYTPHKTAFYPTVAFDQFTRTAPAALSDRDKRLKDPARFKRQIMSKHVGDTNQGPDIWIQAARQYAAQVRSMLPGDLTKRLTLGEAIYGIPGLDPMDMNRSPGWPYISTGQRRPDLVKQQGPNTLALDTVLYNELYKFLSGDFSEHKFVTFLKDETRPLDKVIDGKTRVIDISSFGHAIVGRMLFGNLSAFYIANNGVELGSAIGCDPDIDWTRYTAEFKYGNFCDIDYSGFDSTHSSFSFNLLKVFLKELGFDEIAMAYVESLRRSKHIWDDEQYELVGGLPSGCSCTSLFNTILNNIIVRGTLDYLLDEGDHYQLLAYGDDLIVCSSVRFDVDAFRAFLSAHSMYRVTPASKDGEFKWTTLDDVIFLKRRFIPDGVLIRPVMDTAHLHDVLSWARAGTINEKLQSVGQIAIHSGRDVYDALFEPFKETGFLVPSFDQLNDAWYSKFAG